jgi:hypothetical protein
MLSDKYLWPVPKLTPVHEAYELASFQEPVTTDMAPFVLSLPFGQYVWNVFPVLFDR